jgi:hypothetical protein
MRTDGCLWSRVERIRALSRKQEAVESRCCIWQAGNRLGLTRRRWLVGNGLPELISGRSDARGLKRILKEKRGRSIGGGSK